MKLEPRKSEWIDDWYVVEIADVEQKEWMEPIGNNGYMLISTARISDADIEGTLAEMKAMAEAIKARESVFFRRCAVNATSEPVLLWSPRNSGEYGECSLEEAVALAERIEALGS